MLTDFVRHTRVIEIVGDIIRVSATGAALGDLAIVDGGAGETSTAKVVGIDRDIVSLQVFAGAKGLSTDARVRFLGWRDDVERLLASADVFVCSSRLEPFGSTVLEAWARRVPIVATASEGPAYLVAHDETGLLTPVDDVDALVKAIERLADDPALGRRLADAGRTAFEGGYTEAVVVPQYVRLFERVTDRRQGDIA